MKYIRFVDSCLKNKIINKNVDDFIDVQLIQNRRILKAILNEQIVDLQLKIMIIETVSRIR